MCGRFAITLPPEAMRRLFAYQDVPNFPPRFNIAPTQPIPIVWARRDNGIVTRHFQLARWAFLPAFVRDPKTFPLIFNARSEGLAERASFRNALRRRRCIVPADAFYEWHRTGAGKTARSVPYLCRRADGATMALAALWETWMGPNGEEVDTACIVTTAANDVSVAIHPRLPVVLEQDAIPAWLEPDKAMTEAAAALLQPPGNAILTFIPIGDLVNKVANDGPEIQAPVGPPLAPAVPPAEDPPAQASLF
jgi:putative SOS response-associated peptidase YedK